MSKIVDRSAVDEIILSDGDRVQVRSRLTASEQAALAGRMIRYETDTASGQVKQSGIDPFAIKLAIVRAYLVGWDFKDDEGQPIVFAVDLLDSLDPLVSEEIALGIDKLQTARQQEWSKKGFRP